MAPFFSVPVDDSLSPLLSMRNSRVVGELLSTEGDAGVALQRLIFISLIGRFNRTMTRYLSVGHIFTVNILYATYVQPTHHLLTPLLRTALPGVQSAKVHMQLPRNAMPHIVGLRASCLALCMHVVACVRVQVQCEQLRLMSSSSAL